MRHTNIVSLENIILRPVEEKDLEKMREWRNNPENTMYLRQIPYITAQMQQDWFQQNLDDGDEMTFAIEETRVLNRMVGSLSVYHFEDNKVEFGKILIGDKDAHGKKVGLNAVRAVLNFVFGNLNKEFVYLHVYEDNLGAKRVYKQAGFRILETHNSERGNNELLMGLSREEYKEM